MILENLIRNSDSGVVRVKQTPAGLIIEANGQGKEPMYASKLYEKLSKIAWEAASEIIYSLIVFSSNEERFCVEAILRERPTQQSFNMSTSVLGANDLFCKFTKYDFDVLTLSSRDENTIGLFIVESFSPSTEPRIEFKELDIQGFQFRILSKAKKADGHYEIPLMAGGLD